jgi:hypothetical protein
MFRSCIGSITVEILVSGFLVRGLYLVSDKTHIDQLYSHSVSPACGVCISMISWCGIGEDEANEKKWEVLSNI